MISLCVSCEDIMYVKNVVIVLYLDRLCDYEMNI